MVSLSASRRWSAGFAKLHGRSASDMNFFHITFIKTTLVIRYVALVLPNIRLELSGRLSAWKSRENASYTHHDVKIWIVPKKKWHDIN
jgi:hypothetical protein